MAVEPVESRAETDRRALAEIAGADSLAHIAIAVARWAARATETEAAAVWTRDPIQEALVCTGAPGSTVRGLRRRVIGRDDPFLREVIRDRGPILLSGERLNVFGAAAGAGGRPALPYCLVVPLTSAGAVAGVLTLFLPGRPDVDLVLERLAGVREHAAPALERANASEKKTAGMLQAVERLTNLYDTSKTFGSTLDTAELHTLIARKAADFTAAEMASLWFLDHEGGELVLGATAINENYDVEKPPEYIGAGFAAEIIAQSSPSRRNDLAPDDPVAAGADGYPVRSLLAVPLFEEEDPIGVLVAANKRGRHPEFSAADEELLDDVGRQAVRAIRNARRYEAEKKVQELDALLAVSREITATLDLDRVMQTIVNASAALIRYDRCAIGILDRGRVRIGAVSGKSEIDRKDPDIRRSEELLQWVFFSGADVNVTRREDGSVTADRPETEEKFRALFAETGLQAYYATLLKDEEGKLGVLAFECKEPIVFDEETRDLLQILVNQATVAVRNAQLYQQVPLVGFWKPLQERRRKLAEMPRQRRLAWSLSILIVVLALVLIPWRLRIGGPARVLPAHRSIVTAGVDGMVKAVLHREGDIVSAGEVIATLDDENYQAELANANAAYAIAQSDFARNQEAGNASAMFEAQSRVEELRARLAMEQQRFDFTRLRAPAAGVIVTPRLEERIGQNLTRGAEFCVVADTGRVTVETAVPEEDSSLVRAGQPVDLKLNSYPTRTFYGTVARVGARIREDGKERFVIAEVDADNPGGLLKTGMLGKAKIRAGSRKLITLLLRRPARWLYAKLWPILP
jgi:RND family efflux transporter MFP subunit